MTVHRYPLPNPPPFAPRSGQELREANGIDTDKDWRQRLQEQWDTYGSLDFPTAWFIQRRAPLEHLSVKCSSLPPWEMLCDCGAVELFWNLWALEMHPAESAVAD